MSVEGAGQVQRCLWENLLFPWVEQRFLLQAKGQLGSGPASPSQDKDGSIDTSWKIRLPSCFPTHFLSPSLKETGTTLTEAMLVRNSVSICQCSEHKLIWVNLCFLLCLHFIKWNWKKIMVTKPDFCLSSGLQYRTTWQLIFVFTVWNIWPLGSWQSYNISLRMLAWLLNSLPSGCKFSGYRSETWFLQYSCISIQLWVCKIIVLKATFHPVVMDAAQPNPGSSIAPVFVQSRFYLRILI